jgi:hypothetical protein
MSGGTAHNGAELHMTAVVLYRLLDVCVLLQKFTWDLKAVSHCCYLSHVPMLFCYVFVVQEFTWDLKAKMMGKKALDAAQVIDWVAVKC